MNQGAGAEGLLIGPTALAGRLGDPDLVVVDCRFVLTRPEAGEEAYRAGHVPGARYAHLDRDLAAPRTGPSGRHPLPEPTALAAFFSRIGIGPGTRVVAYDDAGGAIAARLWWLLRWMGHGRVSLLDGGFPAWTGAGLPVETAIPVPVPRSFQGRPGQMPTVDATEVGRGARRLIDVRARERYLGRTEPIDPVAGHVPGALNLPFQEFLEADGRFRPADEIRARLGTVLAGADASGTALMCGSGVTACHGLFALEVAGLAGASLYPGSWSEWIRDPARPVERE